MGEYLSDEYEGKLFSDEFIKSIKQSNLPLTNDVINRFVSKYVDFMRRVAEALPDEFRAVSPYQ